MLTMYFARHLASVARAAFRDVAAVTLIAGSLLSLGHAVSGAQIASAMATGMHVGDPGMAELAVLGGLASTLQSLVVAVALLSVAVRLCWPAVALVAGIIAGAVRTRRAVGGVDV